MWKTFDKYFETKKKIHSPCFQVVGSLITVMITGLLKDIKEKRKKESRLCNSVHSMGFLCFLLKAHPYDLVIN